MPSTRSPRADYTGRDALSLNLGLRTVAEGIEAVEQADRLRELGCQLGQGYLFDRPLGAER